MSAARAFSRSGRTGTLKFASFFLVLLALVAPSALTVSAQSFDEDAAIAPQAMDLSLRAHDDWPLSKGASVDLSPRAHDDWAVAAA
jgi:hypothetical protein